MFGKRVRNRRKQLHMTQADLAKATNISQGRISQLENDEMAHIEGWRLKPLAQALQVSSDWLLELTDTPEYTHG